MNKPKHQKQVIFATGNIPFIMKSFSAILVLVLALIGSFTACKTHQAMPVNQKPIIEIITGPCFGTCPVYELKVYENGILWFNGQQFCNKTGEWLKKGSKNQLAEVLSIYEHLNFDELSSHYDNSSVSDMPSINLILRKNEKVKNIVCRWECPAEINNLISQLEKLRNLKGWEKIETDLEN
ncbi:MAG: hypothetical protein KDC92_05580 [Bacteroidetes bacterium]|nr:hypothetical protein [Bacteroidota bacterium]